MQTLPKVNTELVAGYIKGKPEFDHLFPRFFEVVAGMVEKKLGGTYPVKGIVGEEHRRLLMDRFPELGNKIPIDWVAFGFEYNGLDMYEAHVGVIFLTDQWPIKFHVGVHVLKHIWDQLAEKLQAVDWDSIGYQQTYYFDTPTKEHRFADSPRVFEIDNLEKAAATIADSVVRYYTAVAPIIKQYQIKA